MTIRTHLIEHASMPVDGLSAKTPTLQRWLLSDWSFSDHKTFHQAVDNVEAAMGAHPEDVHMVVICTHGIEETGTWLHMDDKLPAPLPDFTQHNLLKRRPEKLLVYTAVCWGGYPGLVRRFQHTTKPWPVVVGALAPLTADEGNDLQDELVRSLEKRGFDEGAFLSCVNQFNCKLQDEYGHEASRFVSSAGTYTPEQGKAGIAWSLLRDTNGDPYHGPFCVDQVDKKRDRVTVQYDGILSTMPAGRLRLAKGSTPAVGDRFTFKAKRNRNGRNMMVVGAAQIL